MYNRLTPEAKQLLPTFFADRWSPVLRLLGPPTDPDAALAAIQRLLPFAHITKMDWVASPRPIDYIRSRPCAQQQYGELLNPMARRISDLVPNLVGLVERFSPELRVLTDWPTLHHERLGNNRCAVIGTNPWEVLFDFMDVAGYPSYEAARLLRTIALQASAWWFSGEHAVTFAEHPERVVRNNAGEISNGDGPAIVYRDGIEVWVWRGRPTRRDAFDLKTVPQIMHAGMPAVAVEIYGYERFVRDVSASRRELVDQSEWGTLWKIRIPSGTDYNDQRAGWRMFVEVRNSTPPHATHMIPVDPYLRPMKNGHLSPYQDRQMTALDAIASTFGMSGEEYRQMVAS